MAQTGDLDNIDDELRIKYYTTFKKIKYDYVTKPEDLPPGTIVGYWYYGATGTGKSHQARIDFPDAFMKNASNKWWCGYNNEESVLIEDFDKKADYMGAYFKQWVDRYAFPVEIKGGNAVIRPKIIVITSNWHPEEIWSDKNIIDPIMRRFHLHHFTEKIDTSHMPVPERKTRKADIYNPTSEDFDDFIQSTHEIYTDNFFNVSNEPINDY